MNNTRTVALLLAGLSVSAGRAGAWQAGENRPPELVASTEPQSPEDERKGFHLPPGFDIELVACEPDIHKPMNLAFDDRGRLWVTSSLEYPFPKPVDEPGRDAVVILDDFGPDGRARKVTTFADGLNIPIGVLPLREGALVHSIPNLYHMIDTDGDGKADRRDLWYGSIGYRDTHGMASALSFGFDGWIYACHGFANDSTIKGTDGQAIKLNSGNTYRLRPDGSHIEQHTWGQVNPFGLSFSPMGDLFSCDCHSRPIMMLLRGGYYPSFGKPHDGLGYAPEMMTHDHNSTGIAGIVYYAAEQFPAPWRDTVFIGNVVTSRINHDRIAWHGSSPQAIAQPDFLVSDDPWFRPVDIELGPDGALYVADFYNRIIGHYEVPLTHPGRDRERGRIWRIVYRGEEPHAEAKAPRDDWTAAAVAELIDDLGHANLAVRIRAANELVARSGDEIRTAAEKALSDASSPFRRIHAAWVLERTAGLDDAAVERLSRDEDRTVRVHLMRILGERTALGETPRAVALAGLLDNDPFVRRAAAEAVGRHPASDSLRLLLDARHAVTGDDTHQLHVVRIALRNQLRDAGPWPGLDDRTYSEPDLRALADVATGVPSLDAARFLLAHLQEYPEPRENLLRYEHHIARHGDAATDEGLLAFAREYRQGGLPMQGEQVREIFQGTQERGEALAPPARAWAADVVGQLLDTNRAAEMTLALDLAGLLRLNELSGRLEALARERGRDEGQRIGALKALQTIDAQAAVGTLASLLADAGESTSLREQAALLLGQNGRPQARAQLVEALTIAAGKLQIAVANGLAANREGAEALLARIREGKASPRLLQDRGVETRLRASGLSGIDETLEELRKGQPDANEAIAALIELRRVGLEGSKAEADRGAKVFEKHCAACHQVGGKGARIGPQLDGVGIRGPERLLEDILDPNRNVDQAFRATTLALDDGRVVSGLLLREEGEVLVLADAQGQEVRIDQANVQDRAVTPLSLMPANLYEQVPEEDFYDLLKFLLQQREKPPGP
jgi:putative heme-binding domain-containing protein